MSVSPSDHFTSYGTIKPSEARKGPPLRRLHNDDEGLADVLPTTSAATLPSTLHRGLSSRQVQMIAIGGTIGTGLFLGTGRALAQGGPAAAFARREEVHFIQSRRRRIRPNSNFKLAGHGRFSTSRKTEIHSLGKGSMN